MSHRHGGSRRHDVRPFNGLGSARMKTSRTCCRLRGRNECGADFHQLERGARCFRDARCSRGCRAWLRSSDPRKHCNDGRNQGRQTFRFDTFGDEAFWGDQLQLHLAIEGAQFGGVGGGLTPKAALGLGLKVDLDALPGDILGALRSGHANLDDPGTTLALLKANAVVGVSGFFNADGSRKSVGIQCALCHSTVDNSRVRRWSPPRRLGQPRPRRGQIVALAPNLQPFVTLLSVATRHTINDVKAVLEAGVRGSSMHSSHSMGRRSTRHR